MSDARSHAADSERPPGSRKKGAGGGKAGTSGRTTTSLVVVCQVEGCTRRLSREKEYYQRYKICKFHSSQAVVMLAGEPHRFCQQCCCLQHLDCFDGERRSCRERLLLHNSRRKQRVEARTELLSEAEEEAQRTAASPAATPCAGVASGTQPQTRPRSSAPSGSSRVGNVAEPVSRPATPAAATTPRCLRTGKVKAPVVDSSHASEEQEEDAKARQLDEATHLATRASATSSCPSADRLGSSELQDNYPALRSQSAHFSVSEVAEMWARDDAAFGIHGVDEDDVDLGMFGSLSVTLDDLPKDVRSSSLEDASDHIVPAADNSRPPTADPPPGSIGRVQQPPPKFDRTGIHPVAAALKSSWLAATAQRPLSQPAELLASHNPQRQYAPTPTAMLLKRHWLDTQDHPKELFARISWGSGGNPGSKPKRMVSDSFDAAGAAADNAAAGGTVTGGGQVGIGAVSSATFNGGSLAELGALHSVPLQTSAGVLQGGAMRSRQPALQSLGDAPSQFVAFERPYRGTVPGPGNVTGSQSLLRVHAGSHQAVQPLLPDPFSEFASLASQPQLSSQPQQLSPQLQQQPRRSPQLVSQLTGYGGPGVQQKAAAPMPDGAWQAASPQPSVRSASLQPSHQVAQRPPARHPGGMQGAEQQAQLQRGMVLRGGDQPGMQSGYSVGTAPGRTAGGHGSGALQAAAWQQADWGAVQADPMTNLLLEPVHNTVVISGNQPQPVQSPFCLPLAHSCQGSMASPNRRSSSSGPAGSSSAADVSAAGATTLSSAQEVVSGMRTTASSPSGMEPIAAPAPLPLSAVQPFNPYSARARGLRTGSTPDSLRNVAAATFSPVLHSRVAPLWTTRAELERMEQERDFGDRSVPGQPAVQAPRLLPSGSFDAGNVLDGGAGQVAPQHPRRQNARLATAAQLAGLQFDGSDR